MTGELEHWKLEHWKIEEDQAFGGCGVLRRTRPDMTFQPATKMMATTNPMLMLIADSSAPMKMTIGKRLPGPISKRTRIFAVLNPTQIPRGTR